MATSYKSDLIVDTLLICSVIQVVWCYACCLSLSLLFMVGLPVDMTFKITHGLLCVQCQWLGALREWPY